MQETVTLCQHLSITLVYPASGNAAEDLKFINTISPESTGIIVLETCLLLGRGMVTERILRSTRYRLFSMFFHLLNITTRQLITLCSTNYCTTLLPMGKVKYKSSVCNGQHICWM
jgi:hypothetical protein